MYVSSLPLISGFNMDSFNWATYLKLAKAIAAPKQLFHNQPTQVSEI